MRKNELMYWHERIPLEDISWGNLTFLIFRDYDQSGGMELSRCKDPLVTKETSFWQMAKLTKIRLQKVRKSYMEYKATWLISPMGAGVLCSHFYPSTGHLVYFHVHDNVEVVRHVAKEIPWEYKIAMCPYAMVDELAPLSQDKVYVYTQIQKTLHIIDRVMELFDAPQMLHMIPASQCAKYLRTVADFANCALMERPIVSALTFESPIYDCALMRYLYLRWLFVLQRSGRNAPIESQFYVPKEADALMGLKLQIALPQDMPSISWESVLDEVGDLVALGDRQQVLTQYQIEDGRICVDLKCLQIPSHYVVGDMKNYPPKLY